MAATMLRCHLDRDLWIQKIEFFSSKEPVEVGKVVKTLRYAIVTENAEFVC